MKNIKIILKKELRAYFDSPIAYIFIIMFLLLTGAYFISNLFLQNVSSLSPLFEVIPFLLLFFAPAVTMRLISEERKSGTFEVLGTKAIKTGEIVLGKFIAAWVLIVAALVPTFFYLGTVALLGNIDAGPLLGGYIGLLLLGGTFVALGIFGSTLSESQIVAFIISFTIILLLFVVDRVLIYLPLNLVPIVEYLGVNFHFSSLARGVVDSRDLVYYFSAIIFFLLMTSIMAGRETGGGYLRLREFSWKQQLPRLALVISLLVFSNLLSLRWFSRVDLTSNKVYTLSDATKSLLNSLDDNLFAKVYFTPNLPPPYHNHRKAVQELLDEYRIYSHGKFHYQFTNPLSDFTTEQEALQSGIKPVQVKVIKNDQFQMAKVYVGMTFAFEDKHERLPIVSSLERLEYNISSSMKKMLSRRVYRLGFLTGDGEASLESMNALKEGLMRQYDVTTVDLSSGGTIPNTITVLMIVAPQRRLTDDEKLKIDQYVMRGGRIAFFINTVVADAMSKKAQPLDLNLDDMFDNYGWLINNDLVADARCMKVSVLESVVPGAIPTEYSYPYFPIASDFDPNNVVVKNLAPVSFSYVSSIDPRLANIRKVNAEVIVASSNKSARVPIDGTDIDPKQTFSAQMFTEHHVPLAITVEGSFRSLFAKRREALAQGSQTIKIDTASLILKSLPTRMVVVGDGDFVKDSQVSGNDNIAFVTNLVDWLVNDVSLTSIRSRDVTPKPLNEVTEETKNTVKYMNFAAPPFLIVMAGIVRMIMKAARRKQHKNSF